MFSLYIFTWVSLYLIKYLLLHRVVASRYTLHNSKIYWNGQTQNLDETRVSQTPYNTLQMKLTCTLRYQILVFYITVLQQRKNFRLMVHKGICASLLHAKKVSCFFFSENLVRTNCIRKEVFYSDTVWYFKALDLKPLHNYYQYSQGYTLNLGQKWHRKNITVCETIAGVINHCIWRQLCNKQFMIYDNHHKWYMYL